MGYDGKGQVSVQTLDAARAAWEQMGRVPCVLEKKVSLKLELSVVACRATDGTAVTFPLAENEHRAGILATSIAPARVNDGIARRARDAALTLAERMSYVGVLCVEFFVLQNDSLLINEIAPRPHNSGHYTIDACVTSQYEQQARVMANLPLGDTSQIVASVMLNILGDQWFDDRSGRPAMREPDWMSVLAVPGAKLHLYGKREARAGRKMGHVTCVAPTLAEAIARSHRVAGVLGIAPAK
jgi:5-(carboxyamino)imidazole ribonucleotide synthase